MGVALRCWRLGFNGLTYDESFTAMAARLPVGRLVELLRTQDTHPPLDYLLRAPLARAGVSDVVLRLPSALFSIAALALFACWMRDRGRAGLIATVLLVCSSFQILHGGEARMYALLELLGVAGAMLAERWLRRPAGWHAAAVLAIVAIALFDHVSGFLLAAGLFAVAGIGTDRRSWAWRGGVVGAVALWAACWGSSFTRQAGGDWAGWIPRTTFSGLARAVSAQVTDLDSLALVVFAGVAVGGWGLYRSDRRLGRVWLACGALPFGLAAAIGFVQPLLVDRALTVASWAPALALGFLGDYVWVRWRTVGPALVTLALAVVLAGTVTFLATKQYDSDLAIRHLEAVVRDGDAIVTRPARYATLPAYRIGVRDWGAVEAVVVPGISQLVGHPSGRHRVIGAPVAPLAGQLRSLASPATDPVARRPAPMSAPWTDGVTNIRCLEARS